MASGKQTPAPKVSSKSEFDKDVADDTMLKNTIANAEKGAEKKTSATKTPKKIQEGDTTENKREY